MLAHELTHIRNRDTQLMVVAVIFAGIFAFFGDMLIRGWDFPYGWSPRAEGAGTVAIEQSLAGSSPSGTLAAAPSGSGSRTAAGAAAAARAGRIARDRRSRWRSS